MFKPRRVKALSKALTGLFVNKKTDNVTLLNHRDIYYKHYYFPRNLCDLIDIVSRMDSISKKTAAEKMMRAGFSKWICARVREIKNPKNITMKKR